jgi:hypothetical protein
MGIAAREASKEYDIKHTTKIMLKHYARLTETTRPIRRSLDQDLISILRDALK